MRSLEIMAALASRQHIADLDVYISHVEEMNTTLADENYRYADAIQYAEGLVTAAEFQRDAAVDTARWGRLVNDGYVDAADVYETMQQAATDAYAFGFCAGEKAAEKAKTPAPKAAPVAELSDQLDLFEVAS